MARMVPFNKSTKLSLRPRGFEDFYQMLDDFFSHAWSPRRTLAYDTFKMDVQENENQYCIEAELPGVKKEEVNLELVAGRLTISVNREEKVEEQNQTYIHRERRHSSMQRAVYLADARPQGIKASLDDGILRVTVPKQEQTTSSIQIDVESGAPAA